MKTFETEKNNIPEGATHYANENDDFEFAWYKKENGVGFVWVPGKFENWGKLTYQCEIDDECVKEIPIPTETPEEKEASDAIEKLEWNGEGLPPVGVECEWIGGGLNHGDWGLVIVRAYNDDYAWIEKLHDNSMHTVRNPAHFRKPESPEEKEQRERLETAYDLYHYTKKESIYSCVIVGFEEFISDFSAREREEYLAIVDKTNYRKGE